MKCTECNVNDAKCNELCFDCFYEIYIGDNVMDDFFNKFPCCEHIKYNKIKINCFLCVKPEFKRKNKF